MLEAEQIYVGKCCILMTNSTTFIKTRPAKNLSNPAPATEREASALHHDMDLSLPAHATGNVVRKNQQLEARAVAGRHIDKALSKMPASDAAKASRKAKLIDVPDGTPPKRGLG